MRPPIRLGADPRTDSSLRAALRAAKRTPPVDYDDKAGLGRLSSAIATGLVVGSAATKGAAATRMGKLAAVLYKLGLSVKLVGIGIVATGVLVGTIVVGARALRTSTSGASPDAARPVDVQAPSLDAVSPEGIAEPRVELAVPTIASAAAPPSSSLGTVASAKASVTDEIRQLGEIRRAQASDPARALELADEKRPQSSRCGNSAAKTKLGRARMLS